MLEKFELCSRSITPASDVDTTDWGTENYLLGHITNLQPPPKLSGPSLDRNIVTAAAAPTTELQLNLYPAHGGESTVSLFLHCMLSSGNYDDIIRFHYNRLETGALDNQLVTVKVKNSSEIPAMITAQTKEREIAEKMRSHVDVENDAEIGGTSIQVENTSELRYLFG